MENVEARLSATRQKNHELALKYFKGKHGNTEKYEEFAGMYRSSGVREPTGFQEQLDSESERIRRAEMDKIRRKALGVPENLQQQPEDKPSVRSA